MSGLVQWRVRHGCYRMAVFYIHEQVNGSMREEHGHGEFLDLIDAGNAAGLNEALHSILETILQLPWLSTNAGGIFLNDTAAGQLVLTTQINFSDPIKNACARVNYGHCLCGRVAESANLMHVSCVDERHEIRYEGMCNHGHYVVPITLREQLLGVMVLYIDVDHAYDAGEARVLENFAGIIARLVYTTQISQEKQLADLILAHSSHGVVITGRDKKIQWVNEAFEKATGYAAGEIIGKALAMLRSDRHGPEFHAAIWRSVREQGFWEGEIWNQRNNGEIYPEWLNIVALKNRRGEVLRYAGTFIDLSHIRAAEEKIHQLAYYDSITGLPNMSLLHEKLEDMLARSREGGGRVVILTLDLDHFHEINAGLGRRVGDAVLHEAAQRICSAVDNAVVARMGADEFAVAYLDSQHDEAATSAMAGRLAADLNARLQVALEFEQHDLALDSSIGFAWANGRDVDADALLRRAAVALAGCKKQSRGGYLCHNAEMEQQANYRRFLGMAIGKAVERDELYLMYQPQVDRAGQVIGAEVLLRWQSGEYGNIPPDVFIGIAEERGDIIDIGRWVFERTLDQMVHWRNEGVCDCGYFPRMAINVSPHQVLSINAVEEFARACASRGFTPESIELEVTETSIMQYSDYVIEHLQALSEQGFKIAIDDFGTGYSSLSRLRNFPVNILKIDRSFVSSMTTGASDAALVKSIIDMAHTLGFQVIAEGVEEFAQLEMLTGFGCDIFQGYYFSKPVSADEFLAYAKQGLCRAAGAV